MVIASGDEDLELPASGAISVVTLGELQAGVRLARTEQSRRGRDARLRAVLDAFEPIPVSADVAIAFGDALAWARAESRSERATDLMIVATAKVTHRVLHTLDKGQAAVARAVGVGVGP